MSALVRVSEIFGPTIQGEGALVGEPTLFVRTGGCDYRCSWCDSLHAVDQNYRADWTPMSATEIMTQLEKLSGNQPMLVTLSGGNPAIQPLDGLIKLGTEKGYRFALETQGSVARKWFAKLAMLVLSPKPPSSGMETDWDILAECICMSGTASTVLKIVVFDDTDYAYARAVSDRFSDLPIYLQPGNHTPPPADNTDAPIDLAGIETRMRWLVEKVMADRWFTARVLPQLHVLIWGNKRGV